MRIRISDPRLLPQLVESLVRGGCVPSALDAETCEVWHPLAFDESEARTELTFFLRAWSRQHADVRTELLA